MNIDVWSKSVAHRKAVEALPTKEERLRYIVENAAKPKYRAIPMIDLETMEDFYYPRLGPFVIRGHSGSGCAHRTAKEAAEEAEHILEMFVEYLKSE